MKLGEILLIFKEFVHNKCQLYDAIWYLMSIEITTQTTHFHHQYGAISLSRAELTAFSSFCTQQISLKVSQLQPPLKAKVRLSTHRVHLVIHITPCLSHCPHKLLESADVMTLPSSSTPTSTCTTIWISSPWQHHKYHHRNYVHPLQREEKGHPWLIQY